MQAAALLVIASLLAVPACKKQTVADYTREHRADLDAHVASIDEARAHLAEAPRTPGCEPLLTPDEVKSLETNTGIFAREALENPGAAVPPWSGTPKGLRDMIAGNVENGSDHHEAAIRAITETFERLRQKRFLVVAETLPNNSPVGWHGLAFLWDLQAHRWRAAAEIQWSPVSRTTVNDRLDRLDERSPAEIGRAIIEALRFRAVNPARPQGGGRGSGAPSGQPAPGLPR